LGVATTAATSKQKGYKKQAHDIFHLLLPLEASKSSQERMVCSNITANDDIGISLADI
jgi:hypothetical protein